MTRKIKNIQNIELENNEHFISRTHNKTLSLVLKENISDANKKTLSLGLGKIVLYPRVINKNSDSEFFLQKLYSCPL